ncbi:hybrid nucleoside-diphosphate sugar epimerase/sugar transferase [Deinococcus aquatilis]|uniref:hybrid nucleoside-diphosphate sugar epimerase/sugar transferase n=1 Tax=Deinococcus aquatilis TaxID=519440 RepID=UPI00037477C4|nr:hybrid nucleoside-diphosphate sugar epimerase/sugar transferase [Deinococcus aquatilis]
MSSATALIVGASGFVGKALCRDLLARGYRVIAAARSPQSLPPGVVHQPLGDLSSDLDWAGMLSGVDYVIYLAARVHVMNDTHPRPLEAYRALNTAAPLALAQAAAAAGVRHFVYLSSVKVNGELSDRPLTEVDPPAPTDPYGISKWEAEQALLNLGARQGLPLSILRPPLVYGPGVKANFLQLIGAVKRGVPLPLASVGNRRSMVYIGNLTDAIAFVMGTPATAGHTFFVDDGPGLSTAQLVRHIAAGLGQSARLLAFPPVLLEQGGALIGRSDMVRRLTRSLEVDSGLLRTFGWIPPYSSEVGLRETVADFVLKEAAASSGGPYRLTVRQRLYLRARRLVEPLLAGGALLVLAPLLLLLALMIRVTSPGPALFVQTRAGRGHRPFQIYKFRTMRSDAPQLSTEEMRRQGLSPITALGVVLRRTSLDELPQLLNVLKGEMSFVGPRPALMSQAPVLQGREGCGVDQLPPGITGLAQVRGRDDLSDQEKVRYDATYLRHLDLTADLLILRETLRSVLRAKGTY